VPARQFLLQALPIALQALNLYSEAEREGYVTLTGSAHDAVVRVRVRSIHPIADRDCLKIPNRLRTKVPLARKTGQRRPILPFCGTENP
jgi:hypothetical protein